MSKKIKETNEDVLYVRPFTLSPKARTVMKGLAKRERRHINQQIAYIIEQVASGRTVSYQEEILELEQQNQAVSHE